MARDEVEISMEQMENFHEAVINLDFIQRVTYCLRLLYTESNMKYNTLICVADLKIKFIVGSSGAINAGDNNESCGKLSLHNYLASIK